MASILTTKITKEQADKIRLIDENQFGDLKAIEVSPKDLTNHISAFANADGGDLYIGITNKERKWIGFKDVESANGHIQCFEDFFPLGNNFQYEFLQCDYYSGLVFHVQVDKSQSIAFASNKTAYLRRGAQSLPLNTPEKLKRLELTKGIVSFETEKVNISKDVIIGSKVTRKFIKEVVPTTTPENWLRKQNLLKEDCPTVAGTLIFAEEPSQPSKTLRNKDI